MILSIRKCFQLYTERSLLHGQDFLMASLAMQRAVELHGQEPHWLQERDRLLLLIADNPATVLQVIRKKVKLRGELQLT